jgi:hypothetical protein
MRPSARAGNRAGAGGRPRTRREDARAGGTVRGRLGPSGGYGGDLGAAQGVLATGRPERGPAAADRAARSAVRPPPGAAVARGLRPAPFRVRQPV